MAITYKVLSALLSYPSDELQQAAGELKAALVGEKLLPSRHRQALETLIEEIASADLIDAQERYVELFDRSRTLSLHLFEHVHGESRDRGQAMVMLSDRYYAAGLAIAASELPDYVPLFLEYLSLLPVSAAGAQLGETAHILAALAERLERRGSSYTSILQALVALANATPDAAAIAELRQASDDDPNDLAALDRAWEETEVTFGPSEDGCPKARALLERIDANGQERTIE